MKNNRLFVVRFIMCIIPLSRCFGIKRFLMRWAGASIGYNVRCISSANFLLSGSLSIGADTWIGHEVLVIGGDAPVSIGANCDIGPRVTFVSGTHEIKPEGPHVAGNGYSLPITIENGCWIGASATILGGTHIGEKSIIAAGSLVKGNFPSRCLIGGVPARVLKTTLSN
jgi:acetyltransferase-like isoleucine patch superfamily enzyme